MSRAAGLIGFIDLAGNLGAVAELSCFFSVYPEMVDFASGQGRKDHGIFDRRSYATLRIAKTREHRPEPKDAISGWTPS